MKSMPLRALRALAAIYESGGIRAAARQLRVSPSSVHRHLRQAEVYVGVLLTEGGTRVVTFTPTGERLARAAQDNFGALAAAWDAALENRRPQTLTIVTTASFARLWLLPRLQGLRQRHPRIELSVRTDQALSVVPVEADIAIRMGAGPWRDAHCEALMDDILAPVLAPALLKGGAPREARKVLGFPLLHDRDSQASWHRWGTAMGVQSERLRSGMHLTSTDLVLTAASLGLGVALARLRLAAPAIRRGELVVLRKFAVPIGPSYWLVHPSQLNSSQRDFREWLLSEIKDVSRDALGE